MQAVENFICFVNHSWNFHFNLEFPTSIKFYIDGSFI